MQYKQLNRYYIAMLESEEEFCNFNFCNILVFRNVLFSHWHISDGDVSFHVTVLDCSA